MLMLSVGMKGTRDVGHLNLVHAILNAKRQSCLNYVYYCLGLKVLLVQ